MTEWLAMGGHGFFIWSSYGMFALALVIEIVVLRRSRRSAIEQARAMRTDSQAS
ncbi:MAG: heme exporter protein CcmD [Betaproteobacteria bacterium]|nr:heme exporter protein CcmD [Betaproteobacteria bacterium]